MPLETLPFDAADYLDSDEAIEAFLEDALDSGEPSEIARALTVIGRAKARSQSGDIRPPEFGPSPTWPDLIDAIRALGLRLTPVTVRTAA